MVDTQMPAWCTSFGLNPVDLAELDDSSHSFDMKPFSTLDYSSITDLGYETSPQQADELTHVDYMYSFKAQENQSTDPHLPALFRNTYQQYAYI